jgi:hypothetical protein
MRPSGQAGAPCDAFAALLTELHARYFGVATCNERELTSFGPSSATLWCAIGCGDVVYRPLCEEGRWRCPEPLVRWGVGQVGCNLQDAGAPRPDGGAVDATAPAERGSK